MYLNQPVHRGKLTLTSGAAIAAGLAVCFSAAGSVVKAAAGSYHFGVALSEATAASEHVEVQPFVPDEEVTLIASAAITALDYVEIIESGADAGKIRTLVSGKARFQAMEAASAAGDYVVCRPLAEPREAQAAPGALNATGTLTLALIQTGIITSTTAAAVTATVDTGALLDAGGLAIGEYYDFTIINTGGSNAITFTAATGVTLVGSGAVAASSSGRFRLKRTADDTWICYRLS